MPCDGFQDADSEEITRPLTPITRSSDPKRWLDLHADVIGRTSLDVIRSKLEELGWKVTAQTASFTMAPYVLHYSDGSISALEGTSHYHILDGSIRGCAAAGFRWLRQRVDRD